MQGLDVLKSLLMLVVEYLRTVPVLAGTVKGIVDHRAHDVLVHMLKVSLTMVWMLHLLLLHLLMLQLLMLHLLMLQLLMLHLLLVKLLLLHLHLLLLLLLLHLLICCLLLLVKLLLLELPGQLPLFVLLCHLSGGPRSISIQCVVHDSHLLLEVGKA